MGNFVETWTYICVEAEVLGYKFDADVELHATPWNASAVL